MMPTKALGAGEVGYVITGAKDVSQSKVGDTITSAINPATEPLEATVIRNQCLRRPVPNRQRAISGTARGA